MVPSSLSTALKESAFKPKQSFVKHSENVSNLSSSSTKSIELFLNFKSQKKICTNLSLVPLNPSMSSSPRISIKSSVMSKFIQTRVLLHSVPVFMDGHSQSVNSLFDMPRNSALIKRK